MKKAGIFLPAFFMLNVSIGIGQVYFDNLYGDSIYPNGTGRGGTVLIENGYLCWANRSTGIKSIFILEITETGEILAEYFPTPPDSVSEWSGSVIKLNDTLFLGHTYHRELTESNQGDPGLVWFKLNGEIVQRRHYGLTEVSEITSYLIPCLDFGFALIGQRVTGTNPNDDGQGYLIKIDSLGNEQWSQTYGGTSYDGLESLLQTPDSGFLLLGWTRSYGAGQKDWYLVKTDSLGNQQWQQTYGDANNQSGSSIIATMDGNFVMCGGAGNGSARMIKIDPLGIVIWQFDFAHPEGTGSNYLFKVIELADGSLAASGGSNNSSEGDAGWLLKTDSEGNELWQRKYNKNDNTDLFYSVLATDDGGFLLSGQAINEATNSQDAWLLKVDSVGCPYPNCTVAVNTIERSTVVADVWPNPASEVVNVQLQQQGKAQITITDMAGRSYSPPCHEAQGLVGPFIQYDLSTFESGLYLLTIIQNESKSNVRFVVQR